MLVDTAVETPTDIEEKLTTLLSRCVAQSAAAAETLKQCKARYLTCKGLIAETSRRQACVVTLLKKAEQAHQCRDMTEEECLEAQATYTNMAQNMHEQCELFLQVLSILQTDLLKDSKTIEDLIESKAIYF